MVFIIRNVEIIRWWHKSDWETLNWEKCEYNVEIPPGLRQDEVESARLSHSTEITQWDAGLVSSGSAFTGWSACCGIPASSPRLRKQSLRRTTLAQRLALVFWDFFPGLESELKFPTLQLDNKHCSLIKLPNHHPISPSSKRDLCNRSSFHLKKERKWFTTNHESNSNCSKNKTKNKSFMLNQRRRLLLI